jgi:hypothetical protein
VTGDENDLLALFRELNTENRARLLHSARLYAYLEPVRARAEFARQAAREGSRRKGRMRPEPAAASDRARADRAMKSA